MNSEYQIEEKLVQTVIPNVKVASNDNTNNPLFRWQLGIDERMNLYCTIAYHKYNIEASYLRLKARCTQLVFQLKFVDTQNPELRESLIILLAQHYTKHED